MTTDRKKPTAGFWITVALVAVLGLLAGYPLSIGPAEWMRANGWLSQDAVDALMWFYSPLAWQSNNGPEPIRRAMDWYMALWST